MEDLRNYRKGSDAKLDADFKEKVRYGMVYYYGNHFFVKKGFKWAYFPLNEISKIELSYGSRQLRQCCGAPIYQNKILILTTKNDQRLYLTIEETENGDAHHSEKLLKRLEIEHPEIEMFNM